MPVVKLYLRLEFKQISEDFEVSKFSRYPKDRSPFFMGVSEKLILTKNEERL